MKKLILFSLVIFSVNILFAQDDELPPPSQKPKPPSQQSDEDGPPSLPKRKKIDLSKFIIEPNFNFSVSTGYMDTSTGHYGGGGVNYRRIDLGLSPYVGYQVYSPAASGHGHVSDPSVGLYAGGGLTYFYTGFSGILITDPFGNTVGQTSARSHTYGGGVFLQYNIWNGLFARAKFEVLHLSADDINGPITQRNPANPAEGYRFNKIEKTIPDLLLGAGYNLLRSKNFFFPIIISYNLLDAVTDKKYSIYPRALVVQLGFINVF